MEPAEAIWRALEQLLQTKGYTLWQQDTLIHMRLFAPSMDTVATGFMFTMVHRGSTPNIPGNIDQILEFQYRVSAQLS